MATRKSSYTLEEAAELYLHRQWDGAPIPEGEWAPCCRSVSAPAVRPHQRGIWHVAILCHAPLVLLRDVAPYVAAKRLAAQRQGDSLPKSRYKDVLERVADRYEGEGDERVDRAG